MKKLIFMVLGIMLSLNTNAQTAAEAEPEEEEEEEPAVPMALYIVTEETSMTPVADLQKISFSEGNMVVTKKDGTTSTTALSAISRIYFAEDATGIQTITDNDQFAWDGKSIKVNGTGKVKVFLPSGAIVTNGTFTDGQRISLESLPTGIYIIEIGNQSFKIAK